MKSNLKKSAVKSQSRIVYSPAMRAIMLVAFCITQVAIVIAARFFLLNASDSDNVAVARFTLEFSAAYAVFALLVRVFQVIIVLKKHDYPALPKRTKFLIWLACTVIVLLVTPISIGFISPSGFSDGLAVGIAIALVGPPVLLLEYGLAKVAVMLGMLLKTVLLYIYIGSKATARAKSLKGRMIDIWLTSIFTAALISLVLGLILSFFTKKYIGQHEILVHSLHDIIITSTVIMGTGLIAAVYIITRAAGPRSTKRIEVRQVIILLFGIALLLGAYVQLHRFITLTS